MIRARTEPSLKKKAEAILHKLGISASDAINMYYSQIVLRKGIPFLIDLEENDTKDMYTKVQDADHFDELIGKDYRIFFRVENNTCYIRHAGTHNQLGTG